MTRRERLFNLLLSGAEIQAGPARIPLSCADKKVKLESLPEAVPRAVKLQTRNVTGRFEQGSWKAATQYTKWGRR
jgi:hypothetical protein